MNYNNGWMMNGGSGAEMGIWMVIGVLVVVLLVFLILKVARK